MIKNSNNTVDSKLTIYHGGEILTMQEDVPSYAECLVISDTSDGGKIVFVGNIDCLDMEIKSKGKWIDLKGNCVMPGFIDPHIHPSMAAVLLSTNFITPFDWNLPDRPQVKGIRTEKDYHKALEKLVHSKCKEDDDDSAWIITWGYHNLFHGNISKSILDEICPSRPLLIWHRSFHEVYLNGKAMQAMEFENEEEITKHPQVEWENGHFFEKGMELLMKGSTFFMQFLPKLENGYRSLIAAVEAGGITTIADLEFPMFMEELEINMAKNILDSPSGGPLFTTFAVPSSRTYLAKNGSHVSGLADIKKTSNEVSGQKFIMFNNHVKVIGDGAFFSQLMQMKDGYTDGHSGQWFTNPEQMKEAMTEYWKEGFQIHIHTNGDLAMEVVLNIVEELNMKWPRGKNHRTTIEHAGFFTRDQAKLLAKLNCLVSAQPYYNYCLADKYSEVGLGPDRAQSMCPLAWLVEEGVPFALHSDFTMAPAQPLLLAWAAVNRKTVNGNVSRPDLAITPYMAMLGVTRNAANILGQLHSLGTLSVGKVGNLTILEENPLKVDPLRIKDIRVLSTVYYGSQPKPFEESLRSNF